MQNDLKITMVEQETESYSFEEMTPKEETLLREMECANP